MSLAIDCATASTPWTTISSITCPAGYSAVSNGAASTNVVTATTATIVGCFACASPVANYATCTTPTGTAYAASSVTPSAAVCATGFYLSAAAVCSACSTSTLKAGDGTAVITG